MSIANLYLAKLRVTLGFLQRLFFSLSVQPCDTLKQHVQRLAESHMECRFVSICAEKTPFLVERLKIWMMPTLLCVKEGVTERQVWWMGSLFISVLGECVCVCGRLRPGAGTQLIV
jgi:hypothetical protein